jgi:hypothetical protein
MDSAVQVGNQLEFAADERLEGAMQVPEVCNRHVIMMFRPSYPHVNKGASASGHSKYLMTIQLLIKPVHSPLYADTRLFK